MKQKMEKWVAYEKLSRKKQREMNAKRRGTWGALNPVTRKPENPKAYNRQKARNGSDTSRTVPFPVFMRNAVAWYCFQILPWLADALESDYNTAHSSAEQAACRFVVALKTKPVCFGTFLRSLRNTAQVKKCKVKKNILLLMEYRQILSVRHYFIKFSVKQFANWQVL